MALVYAIRRTISSSSFLSSKVYNVTSKCTFACSNVLSKKLSIAEELDLPDPPVKPQQPFVKFISMGHKELSNLTWSERIQKLSAAWNKQTQEEKTRRLQQYYEEKKEYKLQYLEYLNQLSNEQLESIKRVQERRKQSKQTALGKKEKKKELERLGKPKMPDNCFLIFAREQHDPSDPRWKDFFVHAASKWKALSENEKNRYKNHGRVLSEKYETELLVWEKKMMIAGRSELVRRQTYLLYKSLESDGQHQSTPRPTDDDSGSSKEGLTNAAQESADLDEESKSGRTSDRVAQNIPSTVDSQSTPSSDADVLKRTTGVAETRDITSHGQRMVCEEFFPRVQSDHSSNDLALLKRPYPGSRRESGVSPQAYVYLGTHRPAQQRNGLFSAAFPEK